MAFTKQLVFVIKTTCLIQVFFPFGHVFAAVSSCQRHRAPRIAVIGAGIAGASTAHHLRLFFGDRGFDVTTGCQIDVYEAAGRVGGRLAVTTINGQQYESGGSVIHPRNQYMVQFTELVGLKPRQPSGGRMGLFDGKEYLFVESDSTLVNYVKLFWRYGTSMLRLHSFMNDMMDKFSCIYDAQDRGETFVTVDDLLAAMDPLFATMTRITARTYLHSLDFSERFIDELFTAITRVNYGQMPEDLNAFVGAVALAGAQPGLWSIDGGNYQVPKRLLEAADVKLIFSKVRAIKLRQDERFDVTSGDTVTTYDMVFVCVPLTYDNMSGITFEDFPKSVGKYRGVYQQIIATFVQGVLNKTEMRMKDNEDIDEILTTKSEGLFNSLGVNQPVNGSRDRPDSTGASESSKVWKIFSRCNLTDAKLGSLYLEVKEKRVVDWLAYPHYSLQAETQSLEPESPRGHGGFLLYPRLYYTNCIEWAASAMEMSAIAGRNVAMLASKHWEEIVGKG